MAKTCVNLNFIQLHSLKTRVTLFMLAILVSSIWVLAFYISRTLREDIEHQLSEQQFSAVSFMAGEINDELKNRIDALELIARGIDAPLLNEPAALQQYLEQKPILPLLFNVGVFITGKDGVALADYPRIPGRVGTNYSDREHVALVLKEGKARVSKPIAGRVVRGAPSLPISVPIRDKAGQVIGVLVGPTDLSKPNFLDKVTNGKYGKTGGYLIIARQWRLIVTAGEKRFVMAPLLGVGAIPLIDRFVDGYEGSGILVHQLGEERLASTKGIPLANWYVTVSLPTSEAFASVRAMQQRVLLATIVLSLLACGLTWWMLRRELAQLHVASQALATQTQSNRPLQPLPIAKQDEVGVLIGGFNGLLEAITDREKALHESEQRYHDLFDKANEGLVMMTEDGVLTEVNQAFAQMHGYTVDELKSMDIRKLDVLQEQAYEAHADVLERIRAGEIVRFEVEHHHKDGHTFPLSVTVSRIRIAGQSYDLAFHQDITERKRTEEEHTKLEAQLRESQKMEALGTLAGGVAHDFNNALTAILGNVALARQDVGPGHEALVSLEEIGKASRRAKDLVQQILAFSRHQLLDRKPTSLSLTVIESARLIRATLPTGVNLTVDCASDTPVVMADANQIKQILLNLCSNAVYAVQNQGRPGEIEILLKAHTQGEAKGDSKSAHYACLTVRDNGQGMDETTRSHIFDPFFTTKPKGKGTGLGLSVVHGIVKAHEASIDVNSTPGLGTEFHICFPAVDAPVTAIPAHTQDRARIDGKGKHVLYVDDEEAIILLMSRLLERQGYRVSGYTDQLEALAAVRANPEQFDLAVTDYNMPGMTGLEVAQALKEIRPDLPVVMASGYITEELRAQAPAAGIRELIYKPDTVDDLCEAVARIAETVSANSKSP